MSHEGRVRDRRYAGWINRLVVATVSLFLHVWLLPCNGLEQDSIEAEQQREKKIVERFVTVLERNPRRGTAFDRIYGHHVEWGTLDEFAQQYRTRAAKDGEDGTAWMIVGLVESQRGRDADAVEAFRHSERLLPQNAIASYYLGQSLVMIGQPED